MFKNKIKKGELTTQQLITMIVLIVSFGIILFLIFRLNLGEITDKEICHNSVALKGKSSGLVGNIDCKTSYVCISGGGNCEDINPTITKEVEGDNQTQVLEAIAEEMADCWWMFGEGKVDYEGEDWKGYHCAICSTVKFDKSIEDINYEDLFEFLEKNKKSASQTYFQYLYGTKSLENFKADQEEEVSLDSPAIDINEKSFIFEGPIDINERYVILTGINPDWPSKDSFVYTSFVKSSEINDKTKCNVFDLTKA